jgi:hypothetical protein
MQTLPTVHLPFRSLHEQLAKEVEKGGNVDIIYVHIASKFMVIAPLRSLRHCLSLLQNTPHLEYYMLLAKPFQFDTRVLHTTRTGLATVYVIPMTKARSYRFYWKSLYCLTLLTICGHLQKSSYQTS